MNVDNINEQRNRNVETNDDESGEERGPVRKVRFSWVLVAGGEGATLTPKICNAFFI